MKRKTINVSENLWEKLSKLKLKKRMTFEKLFRYFLDKEKKK